MAGNLKTYPVSLGANGYQELMINGDFLRVDSANGNIKVETDSGDSIILREGKAVELSGYTTLRFIDQSGTAQTIIIEAGYGKALSSEMSGTLKLDTNESFSGGVLDIAAESVGVIPAKAGRKQLLIQGHEAMTGQVIISDESVYSASAAGLLLAAREEQTINVSCPVYFHNPFTDAQKVRFAEIVE